MNILAEDNSGLGLVRIVGSHGGARRYVVDGICQSEADENGISTVTYIHAIYGLIRQTTAQRVLMIGCGGGTLATLLAPLCYSETVVDTNPVAFEFSRQFFSLPLSIDCHVVDGLTFLARSAGAFGAIVLDAYAGDIMPPELQTKQFFTLARTALGRDGRLYTNIHLFDDRDPAADQFADALSIYFDSVKVLDRLRAPNRNAIVVAGPNSAYVPPRLEVRPSSSAAGTITQDLAQYKFRRPGERAQVRV